MRTWLRTRLPFLVAAALIAAGIGDPLVETLSGTGIFGAGFADQNHLGVVPALVAAATLLAALFALRCADGFRRALRGERDASPAAPGSAIGFDLPLAVALQLGFVYLMEVAEAALAGTPLQAGIGWLGAPLAWALLVYAAVAVAALFSVHHCLRAMAGACALIVRVAFELALLSAPRGAPRPLAESRLARRYAWHQTLLARNIGGRAPPLSPLAA